MRIEIGGLPESLQQRVDEFNAADDAGREPEDRATLLGDCRSGAAAAVAAQESALAQIEEQTRSGLIGLGQGPESDARRHDDPEGTEKRFQERVSSSATVQQARGELQRRQSVVSRVAAIQRGMTSP